MSYPLWHLKTREQVVTAKMGRWGDDWDWDTQPLDKAIFYNVYPPDKQYEAVSYEFISTT